MTENERKLLLELGRDALRRSNYNEYWEGLIEAVEQETDHIVDANKKVETERVAMSDESMFNLIQELEDRSEVRSVYMQPKVWMELAIRATEKYHHIGAKR